MAGGGKNKINLLDDKAENEKLSEKILFSWEAPSFKSSDKTLKWYFIASFIILAIIVYSAWQKDWFIIGIVVIVSAVMFWYIHSVTPNNVNYKLTPMGVYVDDRFYPFSEMHSFWMVYNQNVKNLYIAFIKKYLPTLTINLENIDPVIFRGYLLKKIPEQEKRGESLIDKLTRVIGI